MTVLSDSISEIGCYDFSGEWKTDIYLDPEAGKLYTFTDTNSIPANAYHKIDQRILAVYPNAIASSVEAHLRQIEDTLVDLQNEYQGCEWNGSNHVGRWTDKGIDLMEFLAQVPAGIAHYWEPDDWFEFVVSELKSKWENGMTAKQIIESENCGNEIDGQCDPVAAIAWLEEMIQEWESEA